MWIHPINSESLGRNKLKTRNQIGIPCVSVNIGIGMNTLPARVYSCRPAAATLQQQPSTENQTSTTTKPSKFASNPTDWSHFRGDQMALCILTSLGICVPTGVGPLAIVQDEDLGGTAGIDRVLSFHFGFDDVLAV